VGLWLLVGFVPPLVLYVAGRFVVRGFRSPSDGFWCRDCKKYCTGPETACVHMRGFFCPECRAFVDSQNLCEHTLRIAEGIANKRPSG
jgi:hypothetical protein